MFSQENAPQTNITFYYTEKPEKNQAYPEKIFKFGFFTLSGQKSLAKQKKLCYNKKCVNLRRFCEVVFHSVPVISAIEMRVAELGKLHFTEDEMKQMASEMTSIIEIMDTVKEIDIQYDAYADNKNVYLNDLREDIKADSFPTEKILQNAVNDENCFVVPKVVE